MKTDDTFFFLKILSFPSGVRQKETAIQFRSTWP